MTDPPNPEETAASPLGAPFTTAANSALGAVRYVLFDVDDTLTWEDRLPRAAAAALYDAHDAGLTLLAVTGRSAAWAELLLRLFPLRAVVAETGGCAFVRRADGRVDVLHHEDATVRAAHAQTRDAVARELLQTLPGTRLALDCPGRLYDTAFDLKENGPAVDSATAQALRAALHARGFVTAQSSVHINAWLVGPAGPFDKARMTARVFDEVLLESLDAARDAVLYLGDSPNDGPMFARAGLSVGVRNVAPHLAELAARGQSPHFVVDKDGGYGVAEVISRVIACRREGIARSRPGDATQPRGKI